MMSYRLDQITISPKGKFWEISNSVMNYALMDANIYMASRAVDKWRMTVINPIRFAPRFVMMNVFSIFDVHLNWLHQPYKLLSGRNISVSILSIMKLVYSGYSFMLISNSKRTWRSFRSNVYVIYWVSARWEHKLMTIRFISFLCRACFA